MALFYVCVIIFFFDDRLFRNLKLFEVLGIFSCSRFYRFWFFYGSVKKLNIDLIYWKKLCIEGHALYSSYMMLNIMDDIQLCTRSSFQIVKEGSMLTSSQLILNPTELSNYILFGTSTSSPLLHFQGSKIN